ncbi:hypothetical protein STRIP9103_02413, partial [Streptomyces ipomoeae 91-03]|jgi:hypothetical protein
MTGS